MKTLFAVGGLAFVGALSAAALHAHHDAAPASAATPAGAIAPTTVQAGEAAPGAARGCVIPVGTEFGYRVEFIATGALDGSKVDLSALPAGTPKEYSHTTHARLALKALSTDADGSVLVGRFAEVDEATLRAGGDVTPPFLVRVNRQCALHGFARLDSADLGAARTQQAILHEALWSLPGATDELVGIDSVGQFRAKVVATSPTTVERHIEAYTKVWGQSSARESKPSSASMRVTLGQPWFQRLDASANLKGVGVLASVTQTTFERVEPVRGDFDATPTEPTRYLWEDLLPRIITPRREAVLTAEQRAERDALRKQSLDASVDAFIDRVHSKNGVATTWPALAKYFEARPEQVRPFAERLAKDQIPEEGRAMAYVALSNTHVPEAKLALMGIYTTTSNHMFHRSRAAFALVSRDDVDAELGRMLHAESKATVQGKTREARMVGRESALALGMMAALQRERLPGVHDEAVAAIADLLQGTDASSLRPAFNAFANLGDATLLSMVAGFTTHPDARVREAAAVSVRRMAPRDSEAFTLQWLAREKDLSVKRRLYDVVEMQHFDAHELVSKELQALAIAELQNTSDVTVPTRMSILKMLVRASNADRTNEALKQTLLRQMPIEHRLKSGLYDLIAPSFTLDEVAAVMDGPPPAAVPPATANPSLGNFQMDVQQ